MKPRIKKKGGTWICSVPHHRIFGKGNTPKAAYLKWAEKLERKRTVILG